MFQAGTILTPQQAETLNDLLFSASDLLTEVDAHLDYHSDADMSRAAKRLRKLVELSKAATQPGDAPTIQMQVKVSYELNGTKPEWLEERLKDVARYAFENGEITLTSEAEVKDYEITTQVMMPEPAQAA